MVTEQTVVQENFIRINTTEGPVLTIDPNGRVFWRKDGQMVQAEVDRDLALAFGVVIAELTGLDPAAFIAKLKSS